MSWEQIAAVAVAAVVVFWLLGAHARLLALRAQVDQAWAKVADAQRQRAATVDPLVAALREPLAAEHGALDALVQAQSQSTAATQALSPRPAPGAAERWAAAESALNAAATRVHALVDLHAEIRRQPEVVAAMTDWSAWSQRLVFARQLYNEAAATYGAAIAQLPTRLVVGVLGFKRVASL